MASEERHYDAVVLGSGPSNLTVSLRLAKNSFPVALVENELVGGDSAEQFLGTPFLWVTGKLSNVHNLKFFFCPIHRSNNINPIGY